MCQIQKHSNCPNSHEYRTVAKQAFSFASSARDKFFEEITWTSRAFLITSKYIKRYQNRSKFYYIIIGMPLVQLNSYEEIWPNDTKASGVREITLKMPRVVFSEIVRQSRDKRQSLFSKRFWMKTKKTMKIKLARW